jgi:hypothetical protein
VRVEGADQRAPRPGFHDDDPTLSKQPVRIDGQTPVPSPWQPPSEPPPGKRPGSDASPGRSRRVWYAIGGIAAAGAAIGLIVGLSSGGKRHPQGTTFTDDTQVALPTGPDTNQAPGTPSITAAREPGGKIKFHWTYTGAASGDSYRWREAGSSRSGVANSPQVELRVPRGTEICLQVQVYRSTGSFASSWSDPKCAG